MVDYTYDFHTKTYDAVYFSYWTTNEQAERVLETPPNNLRNRIVLGGFLAGVFWLCAAFFLPMDVAVKMELPIRIFLVFGGILFLIGGWFAGVFFERWSRSFGPYLVFRTDGSIYFPRLKKTIVPNETTFVEALPTDQRSSGQKGKVIGLTDIIILHEDESYYVITGLDRGMRDRESTKRIQKEITEAVQSYCRTENHHETKQ